MKTIIITIFFSFVSMSMPLIAKAETSNGSNVFTFSLENDAFGISDKYYTSGIELTWLSSIQEEYEKETDTFMQGISLLKGLPFFNKPDSINLLSISLGQKIFTPDDTEGSELIKNDRPYAGIAYLSIGFCNKNKMRMDSFKIDVGIVGPHSYAEQSQNIVHKWFDFSMPEGWENQIKDEPVLNLVYDRRDIKSWGKNKDHFGYDLISHTGFGLGNAYTYVGAGVKFRFGWHLQGDFGMPFVYPHHKHDSSINSFGVNFFIAFEERFVLRDIFLDGNTFCHSHSVNKNPFVADFKAGMAFAGQCFKVGYTHNYRTKKFKRQKSGHDFGVIYLSLYY